MRKTEGIALATSIINSLKCQEIHHWTLSQLYSTSRLQWKLHIPNSNGRIWCWI